MPQLELGIESEPTEAHGKTIEALRYSRKRREDILRMFDGVLPMSIMEAKKEKRTRDLASGSYRAASNVEKGGKLANTFDVSGQSVRSGALSMFPQNIGRAMIRLYTEPGDTIVDPFAGHNSRMELCAVEGRNYHGYDISHEFMAYNFLLAEVLRKETGMAIELYEADSRKMERTPQEYGDFTITSPPYYDLEDYGNEEEQLGKLGCYDEFLSGLGEVARANFRTLKNGAYCIWFVNDFRKRGKFYMYHKDTADLLESVGFIINDIVIVDLGYPIRAAFASQIVEQRILPKRHEYGIITIKQ